MQRTTLVLLLSGFCFLNALHAQYALSGRMVASDGNEVLAYATVSIMDLDSTVLTGTLADGQGKFKLSLQAGAYLVKGSFLGYDPFVSSPIRLDAQNTNKKLGNIKLTPSTTTLEAVEIAGEKSTMELALDKRIFNVGKDLSNAGANASEILSNIPSVTVDGEGNVKLRGSSEVRILIDGRPSALINSKGGAGLQQLQGSLVEAVEVITNPSARYEAEGNAGVINIVLKKEKKEGLNGSFELLAGQPDNFGISANINYRVKKINFFLNYGINYRVEPNYGSVYQEIYNGDTTLYQEQDRTGTKEGLYNNIQGGLDYFFNDRNILTASYRFQRSDGKRITDLTYCDYLNTPDNLILTSMRDQYEEEQEPYSEYVISYKKLFLRKGHELSMDARYLNYWENSDQLFTERGFVPGQTIENGTFTQERAVNDEFEDQYLVQVDYVQPIGKEGKFEAGLRSSFRDIVNDYLVTELQPSGDWIPNPQYDNVFAYDENIHAIYGILGNKHEKVSYQVGLRAEATDVTTTLRETNESNPRTYANLFPSGHLSLHLGNNNDLQVSYSRRVRRPVYFELSPFVTLADGRNFFSGNPDLDPEFTHALEIGHLKYFDKGSISSALYYRNSSGTIQSIRRFDDRGFTRRLPENLNGQESFGAEFVFGYTLTKWWKLDASANFFRAITDGTNIDETFEADTYSWFARQSSKFTLPKQFSVQFRANFQAPQETPQGRNRAVYYFDIAVQKELLKGKGRIALNALDVLNSRINRNIFEGEGFFSDTETAFRRRQVNLTFTYRINP